MSESDPDQVIDMLDAANRDLVELEHAVLHEIVETRRLSVTAARILGQEARAKVSDPTRNGIVVEWIRHLLPQSELALLCGLCGGMGRLPVNALADVECPLCDGAGLRRRPVTG